MTQLSVIVSVLESHEVVRRQLLHFSRIMPAGCELILIDDGSQLPLQAICDSVTKNFDFRLHCTHDRRPWTQPRAQNLGAQLAQADKLLFFDIDHILTREVIQVCLEYAGDKLHWVRRPGILDLQGHVVSDRRVLIEHGLTSDAPSVHANSFMIRRAVFTRLGGYDERFCGRYGGDDIDFNARYEQLCQQGCARAAELASMHGYVFPDPAADRQGLFHRLPRVG